MVLSRKIKFVFLFSLFVTGIFFLYANFVSSSNPDYRVGFETSMRKVFIKNDIQPFQGKWADQVNNQWSISLAKNEYESFQIVVKANTNLQNVKIIPSNFGNLGVEVHPVGYFKLSRHSHQHPNNPLGWYPDVILTYKDSINIRNGDYQPFWVTIHAPKGISSGDYHGRLTITPGNKELTINVHVYDFTLPDKPSLPTALQFKGDAREGIDNTRIFDYYASLPSRKGKDTCRGYLLKEEIEDILIDKYRMWPDNIYGAGFGIDCLKKLYDHYGFIDQSQLLAGPHSINGSCEIVRSILYIPLPADVDNYLDAYFNHLSTALSYVPRAIRNDLYVFILDEEEDCYNTGKYIAKRIHDFGMPAIMASYDLQIEGKNSNGQDVDKEFLGYLKGLTVWPDNWRGRVVRKYTEAWPYTTGFGHPGCNWFIESKLLNTRVLLGYSAYKFDFDGFLYYRMDNWGEELYKGKKKDADPIKIRDDGTAYIDNWDPLDESYGDKGGGGNGQSSLFWPGPTKILPTIRLANWRDGMEDYEYYKIAGCLRGKKIKVSSSVVDSDSSKRTDNPDNIYTERERIAQLIESFGGNASRCRGPFSKTKSSYCGDGSCNNGETCSTCQADCGACPAPHHSTDINQDSKTDIQDLGILLSNWGKTDRGRYDINQDGKTDSEDVSILFSTI